MRRKPCFVDKDSYHLKKRERIYTDKTKRVHGSLSRSTMESGCEHSSSLRNERSGRKSRPHSEDRYSRRTWSERPPRRMVGLCDRVSCVNAYDKMAGKNSSREKILEEIGQTVSHFTALVDYIPNTAKDEVRVTCLKRKSRGTCSGYVLCAGERMVRRLTGCGLWMFAGIRNCKKLRQKI